MDDGVRARWRSAVGAANVDGLTAGAVLADLLDRHAEPHRRYHTIEHVLAVLDAVDALADAGAVGAADLPAVRLAAWFHDAVYDAAAPGNEHASAQLATDRLLALGVDRARADEVARLIELTAGHEPAVDDDAGALLVDADLSILGATPERYDRYVTEVRAEYAHVDDDAWRLGRAALLRTFADRPRLFRTDAAHRWWDARARRNLARELASLERDDSPEVT